MIVAIHQPQYLPWLGYFHKMIRADVFCYLDNVQYKKNEWQNRNRVKTDRGARWVTVPVHYRFPQTMDTVRIDNRGNWRKKHLKTLAANYGKTPFFKVYNGFFESIYAQNWDRLVDLNVAVAEGIRKILKITLKRSVKASDLSLSRNPTQRLVDVCRRVGGHTYLSGPDGAGYMELDRFREAGIRVEFQEFLHPVYPQRFGAFQSHLSVVDLLFNCGPDSRAVIEGNKTFG